MSHTSPFPSGEPTEAAASVRLRRNSVEREATAGSGAHTDDRAPLCRDTVAVLLSRFPLITETFILREICELERQGQPVRLVPLIEEDPDVVHADARPWMARTLTTPLISPRILAACWRRLRRQPLALAKVVWSQLEGAAPSWNFLTRTVALLPKAVYLAERLEAEGIRHVHAHYATHPTTVARVIAALSDIEFSFTAHAHDIFVRHAMLADKLREATFVRTISGFNRDYLLSLFPDLDPDKIRVIPVGIEVDAYADAPGGRPLAVATEADPAPGREPGSSPRRVLCVAGLKPYKGIPVLLKACRRLLDEGVELRCDLVGDGPLRDSIETRIRKLGLQGTVRLLGARSQEQVARLMATADALVLPSVVADDGQMEGLPVVLMEALASGCPVVTSEISGIPELVRDGISGYLTEPGDDAGVAEALRRIFHDPEEARRRAARGRAMVRDRHGLRDNVALLCRELDRVIERSAGTGDRPDTERDLLVGWRRLRGHRLGRRHVRDRPDSRVVELMAADGHRTAELVVKAQRSRHGESRPAADRAAREFDVLQHLHRHGIPTPEPLELDRARAAILMRRCRGTRLDRALRARRLRPGAEHRRAISHQLRAVGRWLRSYQALAPAPGPGDAAQRLLSRVQARAEADIVACRRAGLLPAGSGTLRWLEMLRASFEPRSLRPVPSHGDFWPGNVFVDDDRVEVIDFEGASIGVPWADPGYFLVHLELYMALPLLRRRIGSMAGAFLGGFVADVDEAALRFFRITTSLRMLARSADGDRASPERGLAPRHRRHLQRILRRD